MSEEINQVREALVEAVTAQKLLEEKIAGVREELARWRKRSEVCSASGDADTVEQIAARVRQLELTIAEFQADFMAQQDLEEQLKKTLSRLQNSVSLPAPPRIPDIDDRADSTIERMETKILEAEAFNELSAPNEKEKKLEQEAKSLSLDDELEALKQSLKKKKPN